MIGSKQFTIDATDFVKGMTTSSNIRDGGFSNETVGVNLIADPGVIYGGNTMINRTSNLINGNVIMACGDATYLGAQKFFGTDTGYFYSMDGTYTVTARQSAVTGTWTQGYSDMVQFSYGGNAYTFATNTTNVVRMTGSTLTSLDATWWTVTLGMTALGVNPIGGATGVTTAHPMLVFEDSLWIGDFNKLHKWDGTTASYGFLVLPIDQTIIALGIDPSTGKMLISTTQGANASNTVPKICKVLLWDGFSTRPIRSVIVDDMVTAIYPVGGTVFMPFGQSLGYWNGSGVTFLRRFKNVTLSGDDLIYKHKITSIGRNLYIADGVQALCFGEILPGEKKFYYATKATTGSPTLVTCMLNLGNNQLGMAFNNGSDKIIASYDIYSTTLANNLCFFYTSKYDFKKKILVKEVIVEYQDSIAAAGSGGIITLIDEKGEASPNATLTNTSSAAVYEMNFFPPPVVPASNWVQFKYEPVSAKGVRRFIVSYDDFD